VAAGDRQLHDPVVTLVRHKYIAIAVNRDASGSAPSGAKRHYSRQTRSKPFSYRICGVICYEYITAPIDCHTGGVDETAVDRSDRSSLIHAEEPIRLRANKQIA